MGKIRVKTLGAEDFEKQEKQKGKVKKEQKQARKMAKGAHGGERVVAVGPTEEELAKIQVAKETKEIEETKKTTKEKPKEKKVAPSKRSRSKSYKTVATLVDQKKIYPLDEALPLLEKVKRATFDETVELHLITTETGITGSVTLPHGSGKTQRVAIADDTLIADIEKGTIAFDILLAQPAMMGKLAKVARVLGPRGLMPNPKNGTVTQNPEEVVKKFASGLINYKTEAKNPIMHLAVGKLSFGDKKLSENIKTAFKAIKTDRVKKAILKSTMSPGIKIQV